MYLFIYLLDHLSIIYLPVYFIFIYSFIDFLSLDLLDNLIIYLSFTLFFCCLFKYLFTSLGIYLSIYLCIYTFIYLFIYLLVEMCLSIKTTYLLHTYQQARLHYSSSHHAIAL